MKKHRFSLRKKLVLFATVLALITYSTSGFFIYIVYDYIKEYISISETTFIVGTLLLGIIWSSILAFIAAGLITKPLHNLEKVAMKAAEGDLNQAIDIPKTGDEIGALGQAFNQMLANIKGMVDNIDHHFQNTNDTVTEMKEVSALASNHSLSIKQSTSEISGGAIHTADSMQKTSESIEKARELAEEMQLKLVQSTEKSQSMTTTLTRSKQVVHQLVDGIQQLAEEQEMSLKDVEGLSTNAKQIESIISMVGEISEQTNLLALNASIEAARAGEYGKGFAVVADEIRKLADQSASAVQQISDLITGMQRDVSNVVGKIDDQVKSTRKEAENGVKTNEAFETMSATITVVANEITDIHSLVDSQLQFIQSTVEQSQGVVAIAEETSAATQEVTAVIEEQDTTIHQVDELAQALGNQASELKNQIEKFTV